MNVLHTVLVIAAAGANLFSAITDFAQLERIRVGMVRVGIPTRLLPWLGVPKAAAVLGLLAGFAVPWLGLAAAGGLVLFFLLAIAAHLRVGDRMVGLPSGFLVLAVAVGVTAPV